MTWRVLASGAVVLIVLGLVGYAWIQDQEHRFLISRIMPGATDADKSPLVRLRPEDIGLVADGRATYAAVCAGCHGAALEGQANWRQRKPDGRLPAPPHDLSGHTWHHPDAQLFALTKFGPSMIAGDGYESDMPGFEGVLRDREIIAVLSFIKSTWPAEIRALHDDINRQTSFNN